jgi:N-methylhydantoinase A
MGLFVAVDSGGTFTDLVCFDSSTRRVQCTKALTTHHDPIEGIFECMRKAKATPADSFMFKHGTTHDINTLLERNGPCIALVTTAGFRDVLEFGRGNRTETANLFFRRDEPLVPREHRFEIDERIDGQGRVIHSPDAAKIDEIAKRIARSGAEAVAVSLINAYLNDTHERQIAERLQVLLPSLFITTGTTLSREWYEYERTATAAANAYCGPRIGKYVRELATRLRDDGFSGKFFMMGSSGGVLPPAKAAHAPILLVESGPVGGCIGASYLSRALGVKDVIAFDMGGTTAKCALVIDGNFAVETTYYVGGYGKGIPIRAPVVDIVEVGAGGGSIAWMDAQSRIHVGPKSAGSSPGPVAYGRGGTQPTVTDANLVLGRLNPDCFQGGEMSLDLEAARQAIESQIALPMGYVGIDGVERAASGIIDLACVTMGEAIKRITVQRGMDPRDFVMFAYGGGGPLHAIHLARELAIPEVIIPPEAGNFSALGMLMADLRREDTRTFLVATSDDQLVTAHGALHSIRDALETELRAEVGNISTRFDAFAEMRFVGQHHTVRVPIDVATTGESLHARFLCVYGDRFGQAPVAIGSEIVALHGILQGEVPKPSIDETFQQTTEATPGPKYRDVYYPEHPEPLSTRVYTRSSLRVGFSAPGPAVIEEYGSTTVIGPQDRFEIGTFSEIRIAIGQRQTQ